MTEYKETAPKLEPMPPAMLAEMFRSGIVVIPEEFQPAARPAPPVRVVEETNPLKTELAAEPEGKQEIINWLGNFARKVLVVVNDPNALHLNDADFALLGKIIGAVKLSVADIALVNAARTNLEYEKLNQKLPAKVAIYFGIEPVTIGVPFKVPMFQVQPWNNTTFLYAPSLGELGGQHPDSVGLKKSLWEALKKIFE